MKDPDITTIHVYTKKLWRLLLTSKIFRRFLLAFLLTSLIPLIVFAWITLRYLKAEMYRQSLIQLQIAANGAESQILDYLSYLKNRTIGFASDKLIAETVERYHQQFSHEQTVEDLNYYLLRNKSAVFPECIETFVLDLEGRIIATSTPSNIGINLSKADYFINGQKTAYISDIFQETNTNQITWFVSAPITDMANGTLVGVLVNRINPKSLSDITTGRKSHMMGAMSQPIRKGKTGETYIINRDKLMITESRFLDNVILKQTVATELVRLTMKQGQIILANYQDYRGMPVFGASIFMKEKGWMIITEIDFEEAFTPIQELQTTILLGIGILIPGIFLITWLFSSRFTRPIMRLIQADNAVIEGDQPLAFIASYEIPHNELGDVMRSRNKMLASIKEMELLIQSREKYRLLIESIPDIVWVTDREGNTTFVSPQIEKIYGYTQDEIYKAGNRLWFERIHHDDVEKVKSMYESLFTLNEKFDIEYRLMRKDGSWIWVHDRAIRTYEEGGAMYAEGILTEITQRKQAERRRHILYATTRALAESNTPEEAIQRILQYVCENLEWEVGAFWIADRKTSDLHCVEMWHSPLVNIPEFEAMSRKIVFQSGIGLPGRIYASGMPVWITDVVCDTNFPRSPIALKEGLHGALGFPVLINQEVLGVVEFFSHEIQPPDEDLLGMMASVGGQVGQYIVRKQAEESLRHRVKFENTVANISTMFVVLSDFDKAVSSSLSEIGRLCNVGRAYLFQFRDNGNIMDNTHEWCNEGVTPEIQQLRNIPSATFPWLTANLQAGRVIHIEDVSKMPPDAVSEKTEFERQGIKSILILPIYVEKNLVGFVGFDNVKTTGPWHEENVTMLRIISEIIGSAIARKQLEERITHMAYYDTLTNLPNRNLLTDIFRITAAQSKRNKRGISVIMFDLDKFKIINDTMGHHIGDLLLKGVAERLTQCIRDGDTVVRMGGDEFIIILPDIVQPQDAAIVAQKVLDALRQPFQIEGYKINTAASVGISNFPTDTDEPQNLIQLADIALYASKKKGGDRYHFYSPEMQV